MSLKPGQFLVMGRLVRGSLYKANTTDWEGKPLITKTGANQGQPRSEFFFGVAVPKAPGQTHWAMKPANWPADKPYWGEEIWKIGHAGVHNAGQLPHFAWKVSDGDSTVPNKRGRKPCEMAGHAGHWIVNFSGGQAPTVYRIPTGARDPQVWHDVDAVQPGDFIEAVGGAAFNGQSGNPGVYLNHSMVCFVGYSQEGRIVMGPDPTQVGFGSSAPPAGVSATPVGGAIATVAPPPPVTASAPLPPPPVATPAPINPANLPPPPAGFMPTAPTAPQAPVAPAAPPSDGTPAGVVKTATWPDGVAWSAMVANNWTVDAMRAAGYIA